MPKIHPASKKSVQKWAEDYSLPTLERFFDDLAQRVKAYVLQDFAHFQEHDGLFFTIMPSLKKPGVIEADIGGDGDGSAFTPHTIQTDTRLDALVEIVVDAHRNQPDQLIAWRDAFTQAAERITQAIEEERD